MGSRQVAGYCLRKFATAEGTAAPLSPKQSPRSAATSPSLPPVTAARRPIAFDMKLGSAFIAASKCFAAAVATALSSPSSSASTSAARAVSPPMTAPAKSRKVSCAIGASYADEATRRRRSSCNPVADGVDARPTTPTDEAKRAMVICSARSRLLDPTHGVRSVSRSREGLFLRDLLGIVEAAYSDAPDYTSWRARLLEACGSLDEGLGVLLSLSAASDAGLDCNEIVGTSTPPAVEAFRRAGSTGGVIALLVSKPLECVPSIAANLRFLEAASGNTTSMLFGCEGARSLYENLKMPPGVSDCVGTIGMVDEAISFGLFVPLPAQRQQSRLWVRRLSYVGVHLGAGRRRWSRAADDEAWVDPSGEVVDATGMAREQRHALSLRVRAIEAVRTRSRRGDIDGALSVWKGLVAGTWSLVERFESDGRRVWVAKRNAPEVGRTLRLSASEERVATYCATVHSQKSVGYSLGLSPSMVSHYLGAALLKLGIHTLSDLISLYGSWAAASEATESNRCG